jgi:hypothetical protein
LKSALRGSTVSKDLRFTCIKGVSRDRDKGGAVLVSEAGRSQGTIRGDKAAQ